MERAHTWLWTQPQAALCDIFVSRVGEVSATLPTKVPPYQGKFWSRPSQIQLINTDEHRVRCVAQMCDCRPFRRLCHYCVCYEMQI